MKMKVKDLIAELQKFDPEIPVLIASYDITAAHEAELMPKIEAGSATFNDYRWDYHISVKYVQEPYQSEPAGVVTLC